MPTHYAYRPNRSTQLKEIITIGEGCFINTNARLYDPYIARMLSPDNLACPGRTIVIVGMQDATGTQGFNRYTYVLNNPLKYKDPSGENPLLIAAGVYFLFFTEQGYDVQKYISPVAMKVDLPIGTHQRGIGLQASVGLPQMLPASVRAHGSVGYYWKNYSVPEGWQFTYGYELGITPFFVTGSTSYITPSSPEFNQKLWHVRISVPMLNIKYVNDYSFGLPFGDGGDRYRTAAGRIEIGPFAVGFNLFTGDPGLDPSVREKGVDPQTGKITYKKNKYGNDPDKYRHGVAYFEILGLKFGKDSEKIRHSIQNKLAHDKLKPGTPWFKILDIRDTFYFQFGSGGGYLW